MKNADNTALPPNNLAGAYLVQPKPAGCFWEKKAISNIMVSLCGVSFNAQRMPDLDDINGASRLSLADNETVNGTNPVILDNKVTGLIVYAMNPDQAAEAAQENFIASKLFVDSEKRELDAETQMTFKLAPGKYIVYGRSELTPLTEKPSALSIALELRKVVFSKSLPASRANSLGVILDSLVGNLLLQSGLSIAATGLGLVQDDFLETGHMNATSLVQSNVESRLKGNTLDLNQLFHPTK
jgi:hypothetical protein